MKVLVTGANGFVGQAVVRTAQAAGYEVHAAVRTPADLGPGVQVFAVGDLCGDTDWRAALNGVEAVIHCAGRADMLKEAAGPLLPLFRRINVDASVALARQAAQANVRRLVFLSSVHVNGVETTGRPFRADDKPNPHSTYAQSKLEAEQGLAVTAKETGLEVTVIRPPLVVGPDAKGNLAALQRAVARGLPLPFGALNQNRRDFVSLANLAGLSVASLTEAGLAGQTLMVSDGAPLSTRQLIEAIAADIGRPARLVWVPPILLRLALGVLGRSSMASQLTGDLEVDIAPTLERTRWRPGRA